MAAIFSRTPCLVMLGLLLPCCSGNTTLSLSSYRTTCTMASECVAVDINSVCAACACPDSAINRADEARYQTDFAQARAGCGQVPTCIASCVMPQVVCTGGTCGTSR